MPTGRRAATPTRRASTTTTDALMRVERLATVDGFIVFDLDDVRVSAGGTRLAPDVTEAEVAHLARAMTYKFGILGTRMGGAKAGVRAEQSEKPEVMARYCEEIRPLYESRTFLTGADLGTSEADFALLHTDEGDHVIRSVVDGVPFEDLLTGYGVAAAAEVAVGSLEGRTVVLEGFGKVGGGLAREVVRRGARLVAVSTVVGAVHDPDGLDVERLWELRGEHGDLLVEELGLEVRLPAALYEVPADVVVPGARVGVIDEQVAGGLDALAVVPAANVPYTEAGLRVLKERAIPAHADFVCNAGGVIGYESAAEATPETVLADVGRRVAALVAEAMAHPEGPFPGAVALAEDFIRSWRGDDGMPAGPPLV